MVMIMMMMMTIMITMAVGWSGASRALGEIDNKNSARSRSNNLSVYVILPTLISKWKKEKRKLETLADIYHALSCKRYYESITLTFLMPFSQFDLLRCPPFHNVSAEKKAHTRNVDRNLIAVVCII